jgi:glutaredoxin
VLGPPFVTSRRRGASRLEIVSDITLTLIGKPGCHLCDDARVVVTAVMRQLMGTDASKPAPSTDVSDPAPDPAPSSKVSPHALAENSPGSRLELEELSIDEDPELLKKYGEQIPVLLINGKVHNFWRIDPVRLTNSLKELL